MFRISDLLEASLYTIIDLLQKILDKITSIEQVLHKLIRLLTRGLDGELEEWLSKQQAMDYLGIKKSTYYRWLDAGVLQPRGGAGEDKFLKADLKRLVEARKYRKRLKPTRRGDGAPREGRKGS